MATNVGKVGMVVKGNWNNSSTYEILDVVTYQNGTYIAKQNVPANTAPTNTTYWQAAVLIGNGSAASVTAASSIQENFTVCQQLGKFTFFYARFKVTTALSSGDTIYSGLPAMMAGSLSPTYTAQGVIISDVNSADIKRGTITKNGTIKASEAIAANTDCTVNITYVAA